MYRLIYRETRERMYYCSSVYHFRE